MNSYTITLTFTFTLEVIGSKWSYALKWCKLMMMMMMIYQTPVLGIKIF